MNENRANAIATGIIFIFATNLCLFILVRVLDWKPPYSMQFVMVTIMIVWFLGGIVFTSDLPRRIAWFLALVGFTMNEAVVLANHGQMPVVHPWKGWNAEGVWAPATAHTHFLYFADRFGSGAFRYSVGDVLILTGGIIFLLTYVTEKVTRWLTN